jgi:microsomal dipeptidase-like Zn-dependent dipeptidase
VLGVEAVDAMIAEGILIDITHMRSESIRDVFKVLDARDPANEIPVIATHMACRFGGLQYSFDDATITSVAKRGGVLGCILCEHYMTSGLSGIGKSLEGSVDALCLSCAAHRQRPVCTASLPLAAAAASAW